MKPFFFSLPFLFFSFFLAAQSPAPQTDTLRADTLFRQAMTLRLAYKVKAALPLFQESAALWRSGQPGGSLGEAKALFQSGFCLFRLGKYTEAEATLQNALALHQRFLSPDDTLIGANFHHLGLNCMELGHYEQAIQHQQKALDIYLLRFGKKHWKTTNVMSDLGASLGFMGHFRQNMVLQEEVLSIRQTIFRPNDPSIARSCMALGIACKLARRFPEALAYYQQALDIFTQNKSPNMAYCCSEIGLVYLAQKDPLKALEFFEKERKVMAELGEENHNTFGYTCVDLGKAHYALGHYQEAIQWQQKAIHLFRDGNGADHAELAPVWHHLGLAQAAEGQFENALASFAEDRRISRLTFGQSASREYHLLSDLAHLHALRYDRTQADSLLAISLNYYIEAAHILEEEFKRQTDPVLQKKYLFDAIPVMEQAIHAAYRRLKKYPRDRDALQQAWQWSEYVHGFLLNTATQETEGRKIAGIPPELLEKETHLRLRLTSMSKYASDLTEKGLPLTHPDVLHHHARQSEVQAQYDALMREFSQKYPAYYRLKHDLAPIPLREIQQHLKAGQTLLEYFTGDSSIFAFVVRPDTALLIRISRDFPLKRWISEFREGITGYHTALTKTSVEYERTVRQYARTAHALCQKLLAPVAPWLTSDLIIIPDAELNYLPFEALVSTPPADVSNFKTYPFVVLERNISYAYSATLYHQIAQRPKETKNSGNLLGFAPFFNADTAALALRLSKDETLRNVLSPLPYSGEEIWRADRRAKGKNTIVTGAEATLARFCALAPGHRILHLATHAKANEKTGEWSYIAFAPTERDTTGLLYAGEVYNLRLHADLVVLSACETGTGELQYGEGVISLARAFYYAGARSVATSLWKVNDQATMRITDRFYSEWTQKKSVRQALTNAKRQYLHDYPGAQAHPFFWAGLVLAGE